MILFRIALFLVLGFGSLSMSNAQSDRPPIAIAEARSSAFPLAIYRDIKANDLHQILVNSFLESNFSLIEKTKDADGSTTFQFAFPIDNTSQSGRVVFGFKVDGTVVNNKCMNCFLRWGRVLNEKAIGKLPWMTQYDLSSRLYPAIDQSYASIKSKSQNYLDSKYGFVYKNMWSGERNQWVDSNVYVNVKLPDLKQALVRAFTEAGFVLLRDSQPAANASDAALVFSFPIDSDKPEGVVYAIRLASQFDADGLCFPCEAHASYDPYQTLPPAGLSAMTNRLTLASRLESGLNSAYDRIKASTERYLRPRTQFTPPPKFVPPGSTRPLLLSPVVT